MWFHTMHHNGPCQIQHPLIAYKIK
uniref:Uncharacterized protein n=1 Tax=Arundo donax TaxID=35708 RepID=A0A0A9B0M1_ARUDO